MAIMNLKRINLYVIIVMLLTAVIPAGASVITMPQGKKTYKKYCEITGRIVNEVTRLGFKDDTIKVELLNADSVLIDWVTPNRYWNNYPDPAGISNVFSINGSSDGQKYILRLSHPDYATVCYDIEPKGKNLDVGVLKIRKLSRFEKAIALGEVTVRASVVAFVNKGDTLQYNADAFNLAQGSMLDALIYSLPGVELKDDGRIYVNGRFVEKLLLDGKDFFRNNQFVLLQNLPAYTVKNVQVYEKVKDEEILLGGDAGSNDKNYVMDVKLKKGYNAGWLANVEAAGGTHGRYRGRGFGLGYTNRVRIGAYGLINNINETRKPGRSGEWSPADNAEGIKASKGGGLDYGIYRGSNELQGEVTALYSHTDRNEMTGRQNFLNGGDTYTQRWSDEVNRNLDVKTAHKLRLRSEEGNKYFTEIELSGHYKENKTDQAITEATFNGEIEATTTNREELESGWPKEAKTLNRMLEYLNSNNKEGGAKWDQTSTFSVGNGNVLRISTQAWYEKGNRRATDDYLLQYAGEEAQRRNRENPRENHKFQYWGIVGLNMKLNRNFRFNPRYYFGEIYGYNSNEWYDDSEGAMSLKSEATIREMMLRLDPRNSYTTGDRRIAQGGWVSLNYTSDNKRVDNRSYRPLEIYLTIGTFAVTKKLAFNGIRIQRLKRSYVEPESNLNIRWKLPNETSSFEFKYKVNGNLDMMNLVDVEFTSDPLNPRRGNPDLKMNLWHNLSLEYQLKRFPTDRWGMSIEGSSRIEQRATTMAYSYDYNTGVRTVMPVNVTGNYNWSGMVMTNVFLDRQKRLTLRNTLYYLLSHTGDLSSTDNFRTLTRNNINDGYSYAYLSLEYRRKAFDVSIMGVIDNHHTVSTEADFEPFNVTGFNYGVLGKVKLPFDIELSSDLNMYSRRGHAYKEMNTNQLVWNAQVTKPLLKGALILGLEGYDILGKVKAITYSQNQYGRTETWVNGIPSYVMVSLRWNFAKKPRE